MKLENHVSIQLATDVSKIEHMKLSIQSIQVFVEVYLKVMKTERRTLWKKESAKLIRDRMLDIKKILSVCLGNQEKPSNCF